MKNSKKLLVLALSAILALGTCALASCGNTDTPDDPKPPIVGPGGDETPGDNDKPGDDEKPGDEKPEPTIDFSEYTAEQFLAEDFSAKEISYQLTGLWDELPEYNMGYGILYNLYKDGSLKVDQINIYTGGVYSYYGFWEEDDGTFGHEVSGDTMFMTNVDGTLIAKAISNTFYEEDGGTYSDKFNFDLAPGMYSRQCEIAGSSTVTYKTLDEYFAQIKKVVETGKYTSEANASGVNGVITTYSDGTLTADLCMDPYGVINQQKGSYTFTRGEDGSVTSTTFTFAHYTDGVKDSEDTTIAFEGNSFTWTANFMGQEMVFEMIAE